VSRSQHATRRAALTSYREGDVDRVFAYCFKRNVKKWIRVEKKIYAMVKVGRPVMTIRNGVVYKLIKKIMKTEHSEG